MGQRGTLRSSMPLGDTGFGLSNSTPTKQAERVVSRVHELTPRPFAQADGIGGMLTQLKLAEHVAFVPCAEAGLAL